MFVSRRIGFSYYDGRHQCRERIVSKRFTNVVKCLSLSLRLPDSWVSESDRPQMKTKVVHLSQLPQDTAVLLDPNIYR